MEHADNPLCDLAKLWLENIKRGIKAKTQFNKDALEGLKFFDGPHDWIFNEADSRYFLPGGSDQPVPAPAMKVTANRVFELVSIFGPMLYPRNPQVLLDPRKFPDLDPRIFPAEMMAQAFQMEMEQKEAIDRTVCAELQAYLNYIPNETHMRDEARQAVEEALIKGVGAIHVSVETPPGSSIRIVVPRWVKIDRIVLDPDAECMRDVQWIAMECLGPTRQIEREYELPAGYLKSHCKSSIAESAIVAGLDTNDRDRKGKTYDMTRYWKVWTKIGLGRPDNEQNQEAMAALEEVVGDYAFIAVAEGCPHPLNMPMEMLDVNVSSEKGKLAIQEATSWQVPHWMDNAWPIEFLYFHTSPNQLWPISHIKPALGEQYWLDWVYSLLATKVQRSCLTRVVVSAELDEENTQRLYSNRDYEVLKVDKRLDNIPIESLVKEIHMGEFNPEIAKMAATVEELFAKRTGMLPFLYGQQGETQIRSAAEASGLQSSLNIRPDDMREQVENWTTRIFRRMALCARYWIKGQDVAPILGRPHAMLWDEYVTKVPPEAMVREFEYRIEAGNPKKPNSEYVLAHLEQAAATVIPLLSQYAQANPENLQVLNAYMRDMAKAAGREWKYDILPPLPSPPPDPSQMMGQQMPPGQVPPQDQQVPPEQMQQMPQEQMPPEMMQGGGVDIQAILSDPNLMAQLPQEILAQLGIQIPAQP